MVPPRPLTADERLAAEAAWRNLPLDPAWSGSARAIHAGMTLAKRRHDRLRAVSERNAAFVEHANDPDRLKIPTRTMKPTVTKISSVPRTALLCCPQCTHLISYERGQDRIVCRSCGATLPARALGLAGSPLRQK